MIDDAARARAEAMFKSPQDAAGESVAAAAERAAREKTERLREMRLAKEALVRKGAQIRAERRRGS